MYKFQCIALKRIKRKTKRISHNLRNLRKPIFVHFPIPSKENSQSFRHLLFLRFFPFLSFFVKRFMWAKKNYRVSHKKTSNRYRFPEKRKKNSTGRFCKMCTQGYHRSPFEKSRLYPFENYRPLFTASISS